ncbi:hypothetical protein V1477_021071 [Vespula maculifrons]|uniref:Uncharacterized protein n=1 Tax=Vespula maculifrons TaxID=7453 RepID=A0ABD2AH30_VESMC
MNLNRKLNNTDNTIPPTDTITTLLFSQPNLQYYKKRNSYGRFEKIRDELRISDFFISRLLKSNIKVNGCQSNALAIAASCFHTPLRLKTDVQLFIKIVHSSKYDFYRQHSCTNHNIRRPSQLPRKSSF